MFEDVHSMGPLAEAACIILASIPMIAVYYIAYRIFKALKGE